MKEEELKEYMGCYFSPDGTVYGRRGQERKLSIGIDGYYKISLYKDMKLYTKSVHRVIAELFIPNPNGYKMVSHIDGNKLNNRVDNLKWVSHNDKAYVFNTAKKVQKVDADGNIVCNYLSIGAAARDEGVSTVVMSNWIKRGHASPDGFRWVLC